MNKCTNCNLIIYDDRNTCPLCHKVIDNLVSEDDNMTRPFRETMEFYPDVRSREKKISLFMKILLFGLIVGELVAILINYLATPGFLWSAIAGFSAIYMYLSLVYWVRHDSGFSKKIGLQFILTMVLLFAIDYYTGYRGWALSWAIPGLILFGDAVVFFFMMLYMDNWYSYSMLLILFTVLSVGIMGVHIILHIPNKLLAIICVSVTCIYLLGTIIFGNSQFRDEMKRRFHV